MYKRKSRPKLPEFFGDSDWSLITSTGISAITLYTSSIRTNFSCNIEAQINNIFTRTWIYCSPSFNPRKIMVSGGRHSSDVVDSNDRLEICEGEWCNRDSGVSSPSRGLFPTRGEALARLRRAVDRRWGRTSCATPVGGDVSTRGSNRALRIDEPALPVSPALPKVSPQNTFRKTIPRNFRPSATSPDVAPRFLATD